ncbi:hypothetical protein OCU04_010777 [Sclerotinia nivalis]|uniref:Uncharacterized protein n=1 Tax=Sclerotinia nivalis TaxID=352851 RepID=A0A9X0DG47_9HELO|nr:hypothetical protein OCU04_010777 [Sclerotinia nivalis]
MDPSNSGPASLPTTAWPRSPASPANREEPATAVSLPTRNSEWVDDCISTAFPQTARPRSDLLAPFFPPDASQGVAAQSPIQTPTSAYHPTPVPNQTLLGSGYGSQNDTRLSSNYSEYAYSPRFARDVQEMINSPTSIYPQSALPDPPRVSRDFISTTSKHQRTAHPGPSRSPNLIRLSDLTQSPVSEGIPELFPKSIDVQTGTSSRTAIPQVDFLSHSPAQQQHVARSQPQEYQPQFSAPPGPSNSEPPTRATRSSSIIIGFDQGIYRPPSKFSQNLNNRDLFYATQKDDSRFSRNHPSSRGYIHRRRANSLDRTSVPTDPQVAKLWDERINSGQQPFTPTDRIPTYQEFRRTTQPVDSPRSDQFPLPASALSQYENIPTHLRPARKSDLKFHPKLVQEIYEERWKITAGYEDLQAYFSDPKQGPYKHLKMDEWVELYEYLEERDRKVTEREIVFELRAS